MPPDPLGFIVPLYRPLVLALAVFLAGLGLTGLLLPNSLRTWLKQLESPWPRCVMGAVTLAVGIVMALRPSRPYANVVLFPSLTFWLGVLVALKGALWLVLPGPLRWVLEFHIARNDLWHRFLGFVCLAAAALFFLLSKATAIVRF